MNRPVRLALLCVGLLVPMAARAEDRSEIRDEAGMFSKEAISKAQATLAEIDRTYRVAVTVETIDSLKGQTINEATERRAEQLDHKGVFVLIANKDHRAQVIASRSYRDKIGSSRLIAIRDAFTEQFRQGKTDEGLQSGVRAAASALEATMPRVNTPAPRTTEPMPIETGRTSNGTTTTAATPGAARPAGASPYVATNQARLTLAGARKAVEGAEARAAKLGLKSNIAVVDDGGHLLAFARMDGSRPASVATSITKATSAATFRQASGPLPVGGSPDLLLNLAISDAAQAGGGRITALKGGLPILVDDQVVGAIGVAGGDSEQDVEVAKAGVEAFNAAVKAPPAAAEFGEPNRTGPVGDFDGAQPKKRE